MSVQCRTVVVASYNVQAINVFMRLLGKM